MEKYIEPLYMGGLHGRMLRMPATGSSKREILLVYGHHSSLERMFSLAEVLNKFGTVTMPDLPGFGGMEPFYKIGEKPNIESYADYLAAFIKLRYKRKKFVVIGFSYSVPVIIRTLQKYPELAKKVDFTVSIAGFVHKEDFALKKTYINWLKIMSAIGSNRLVASFLKFFVVRGFIIRTVYRLQSNKNEKMRSESSVSLKDRINFEVTLWTVNDLRTWMKTTGEMFGIDLLAGKLNVPLHHVVPQSDVYFNANVVEQHMRIIASDFTKYETKMPNHAPSVIASAQEIEPFFPKKLQKLLKES